MTGILLPISVAFVLRAALEVRLVIPCILPSMLVAFKLKAVVVTKPVVLGILFSVSVIFVL